MTETQRDCAGRLERYLRKCKTSQMESDGGLRTWIGAYCEDVQKAIADIRAGDHTSENAVVMTEEFLGYGLGELKEQAKKEDAE